MIRERKPCSGGVQPGYDDDVTASRGLPKAHLRRPLQRAKPRASPHLPAGAPRSSRAAQLGDTQLSRREDDRTAVRPTPERKAPPRSRSGAHAAARVESPDAARESRGAGEIAVEIC